ncbi:MAG: L-2-amino-thiazoline-4-carboxylic acid hydrolase [Erysipelotrichaceae bacterium]|nr:L-2-amino-thiazoline-4-carboxylic acid hydrolase [Erysipelotrichaceae bacterium]
MADAEKIMKKKSFIKKEMDKHIPKQQSDDLWRRATVKLEELLETYKDIPKGVKGHTENYIFPSASLYLIAKEEIGQEKAYEIVNDAAVNMTSGVGKKLAAILRIPGMKDLFAKIWDPMTRRKFGPDNGFENVFYQNQKNEFRMDILCCPYVRYFTELGCPELTKIYCANDERVYGDLPGIEFRRSGTLGTGAKCCDFYIRKKV